jgi:hypothetical protein
MDEALLTDLRFHRLLLGFDQDLARSACAGDVCTVAGYCIRRCIGVTSRLRSPLCLGLGT